MEAPRERLAYVAALAPDNKSRSDAMLVVDVDSTSSTYGSVVGAWIFRMSAMNYITSDGTPAVPPYALMPLTPTSKGATWWSRDCVLHASISSTPKPDPRKLEIVKTIEPEEIFARTGYSRPHTVHCGPEGIYVSALGAPNGGGPGGIFILDHLDFNVLGRWEVDRGPQELAYDFWWHLGHDTLISSEWANSEQNRERTRS